MVFYKSDWRLYSWLFNVYHHLQKDYDFLLIIVGDTGSGKSRFGLQLLDAWYRVILGREVTPDLIKNFNTSFSAWSKRMNELEPYELNIFDEGSTALDSKDHMSAISKNLSKIFNVVRYKRIFSVVILPNFFNLNKYFRENRLRGVVHIDKRGHYRLFSRYGVNFLNGYNANRSVKSMFVAFPVHSGCFPDYKGVLLEPFDDKTRRGKDMIIADIVSEIESGSFKKKSLFELYGNRVLSLLKDGCSQRVISERVGVSVGSVNRLVSDLRKRGMY